MAEAANHVTERDRLVLLTACSPSQPAIKRTDSHDRHGATGSHNLSTGKCGQQQSLNQDTCTPGDDPKSSSSRKDAGFKHGLIKKFLRRQHTDHSSGSTAKSRDKASDNRRLHTATPEQKMGNVHQGSPVDNQSEQKPTQAGNNSPVLSQQAGTTTHPVNAAHHQHQQLPSNGSTRPPGATASKIPIANDSGAEMQINRLRDQLASRDRRIQELEREVDKLRSVLHQQLTDTWVQPGPEQQHHRRRVGNNTVAGGLETVSQSVLTEALTRGKNGSDVSSTEVVTGGLGDTGGGGQLSPTVAAPPTSTVQSGGPRLESTPPAAALLLKKRLGVSGEPMPRTAMELKYYDKNAKSRQQIRDALRSNDLLTNLDAVQLQETVSCMHEQVVPAGCYIIREADDGEHLYVGAVGEFEVTKEGRRLCIMPSGHCFGELALLYNCKRTASVKAITEARVWVLDRSSFQTIMRKTGLERLEERKAFLRSVSLFKNLSSSRILRIADALEAQYHAGGDCIIRQGELAHSFFIIQSGKVRVTITKNVSSDSDMADKTVQEVEVRHMSKGDCFGEIALLSERHRTANVYAVGPNGVEVLCLYREDFLELVGDVQELKDRYYMGEDAVITPNQRTKPSLSTSTGSSSAGDRSKPDLSPFKVAASPTDSLSLASASPNRVGSTAGLMPLNADATTWKQKPLLRQADIKLTDLERVCVLGVGGFGRVDLVTLLRDRTQAFALKRMQKQHIVQTRQQEHVHFEKIILASVSSPFICQLYATYRDRKYIYMLTEACLGGELWTLLRDSHHLEDRTTKFCLACCIEALDYLHRHGIIYRDLKPENLLITAQGYIKLCDFGFAKYIGIGHKTWTFCGTPEYVAPEVILNKGHDYAADYWSLGILTYELLTGTPPFQASEPIRIYTKTLKGIDALGLAQNKFISLKALHFMRRLCRFNPSERMGIGRHGVQEIRNHKYFQGFDWVGIAKQTMATPFKVKLNGPLDSSNFDRFTMDEVEPPDEMSGWDANF